jgi:hypothetical protein
MAPTSFKSLALAGLAGLAPLVSGLGQKKTISFEKADGAFQIAGGGIASGQVLVSDDDYWGVIRAAGDLATDFGRVTGKNFTLSSGQSAAAPAEYTFAPVDISDNTKVSSPFPCELALLAFHLSFCELWSVPYWRMISPALHERKLPACIAVHPQPWWDSLTCWANRSAGLGSGSG